MDILCLFLEGKKPETEFYEWNCQMKRGQNIAASSSFARPNFKLKLSSYVHKEPDKALSFHLEATHDDVFNRIKRAREKFKKSWLL